MSRYQSIRPLGIGPDGVVEEVRPDRLGGAPLARRRLAVPAGPRRHRLRDLAESLARLGHPGIGTVVDIVDVDEAAVEVLTTLGTDGTLADRTEPMDPTEVRAVLEAVADSLAAAHGAGVAHGHVSPSNVVGCHGRPVLVDFGLAEARSGRPAAQPFRADVRDLAVLGTELVGDATGDPAAASLRTVLHWVADDPDATLADLRAGLAHPVDATPPPPPPVVAPAAAPTVVGSSRRAPHALIGAAALALGVLAGAASVLVPGAVDRARAEPAEDVRPPLRARSIPCPPVDGDLRADVDGDGCDEPVEWRAADAEVAYRDPDGALLRFRVGRPGDDLVLGDWDCDGTATAAVVRPSTGETFLFDGWAATGQTLTAEPGPALPIGAMPTVVHDGGCDRIEPAGA